MVLVTQTLSDKLAQLLTAWTKEEDQNQLHDVNDSFAWNELVAFLTELERRASANVT